MALTDLRAVTKNLEMVNRKLQDSERLKTDFLSNIRNEINNPLTVMVALSEELATAKPTDVTRFQGLASMLHKEALSLDFQIRNVLVAAELESGECSVHVTRVNVHSLIDDCVKNLLPIIEEKGIVVEKKGPSPAWINTDSEKLQTTLSNLLHNAVVFSNDGGVVEISFRESDETFICSIRDEGIGMKKEDHGVIFDRFKQLDTGMRKRYMGHGIGLSVAKGAVNFMDGDISVESEPGKGSIFTVTVPLCSEEESEGFSTEGMEFFGDDLDGEQEF
jgi:signal transduction histidine kinase